MGFPKDPQKREAYRENMRLKLYERLADPERKRLMDERKREASLRPEVKERRQQAQRKRLAETDPAKLEADKEKRRQSFKRPEVKERISKAQKQRFADPEQRKADSERAKKAHERPEVKERTRASAKKRADRSEEKALRSARMKKLYAETDIRERVSQATKEAMQEVQERPEFHENLKLAMQAYWSDPDAKAKGLAALRAGAQTPEAKQKLAEAMKVLRATPEYNEAVARGKAASWKNKNTDIEIIVEKVLQALEVDYEPQKHFGRYIVDFYIPSKNLVIECDGDYWHSLPEAQARDIRKDAYLASKGHQILRLLGSQIYKGDLQILEEILSL